MVLSKINQLINLNPCQTRRSTIKRLLLLFIFSCSVHAEGAKHASGKSIDTTPFSDYKYQLTVEQDVYDTGYGTYYSPTLSATPVNNQTGSIGLSLSGQNISLTPSSPVAYANIAGMLNYNEYLGIAIGTMEGYYMTNQPSINLQSLQSFHYATVVFNYKPWGLSYNIGPYYMNKQMSSVQDANGNGYDMKGVTMALNYNSKTWNLNTSFISGYSNIGGLNMDIGYNIGRFMPYLGMGFATNPPVNGVWVPVSYYWASGLTINF